MQKISVMSGEGLASYWEENQELWFCVHQILTTIIELKNIVEQKIIPAAQIFMEKGRKKNQ